MLEEEEAEETDLSVIKPTPSGSSRSISVWSGFLLTFVLGVLSYILYLQVNLSKSLAPLSLNYDSYTKFGVISDLHLDMKQNSGSCADWNRTYHTHYNSSYGTTGCDTKYNFAEITVNSFSDMLNDVGNVDLVFCLGDFVNHYTNNFVNNRDIIANSSRLLQSKLTVPVYSSLGNNDMPDDYLQPANSSQFFESIWMRISPLMNASNDKLSKHEARDSFISGGYYTIEHSDNLQIVSLNSVAFSVKSNVNESLGMEQLQWLSQVLSDAKLHGRAVVVIGHICPSLSLFQISRHKANRTMMWKEKFITKYNEIVSSYTDIIKFSLFSHHHANLWFVKQMQGQDQQSNTGFVSYHVIPSISPVYENEPSYAVGIVDQTWNLLDLWNYFCPLSFYARQEKEPEYLFQFSFKESYFNYDDVASNDYAEDIPISNEFLFNLTSRLLDVQDMQETYKKIVFNSYQFLFNFANVSPYQMFCVMTEDAIESLRNCLTKYKFMLS